MASVEPMSATAVPRLHLAGWPLFFILAATLLAAELRLVSAIDWSSPGDIRWLMGINRRLAAPCFLLTFTVSPLHRLFPHRITRWLVANRRYFGLAFAVGAACQLIPIVTFATRFPPVLARIHAESSQYGEDAIYLTLVLMTVTSFEAVSRYLSRATWRRLHATGMYLLAGLYTVSYVYFALNEPNPTYLALCAAFVLAWGLRAAVWWRRRAELRGWKLFWALGGSTSGAMLASWSYFGIESERGLQRVLAIAVALAGAMLLGSIVAARIEGRLGGRTAREMARLPLARDCFLMALAVAVAWYVAFALAGRLTLEPHHAVAQAASSPVLASRSIADVKADAERIAIIDRPAVLGRGSIVT